MKKLVWLVMCTLGMGFADFTTIHANEEGVFPVLKQIATVEKASVKQTQPADDLASFEDELDRLLKDVSPHFKLDMKVGSKVYYSGEPIRLAVRSAENAFLYVFSVNTVTGEIGLLYPNELAPQKMQIEAGKGILIPDPNAAFEFCVVPPFGEELVVALAVKKPLSFKDKDEARQFARFLEDIRSGEHPAMGLVTLKGVISKPRRTTSTEDWAIASVRFKTMERKPNPDKPNKVSSSPSIEPQVVKPTAVPIVEKSEPVLNKPHTKPVKPTDK